MKCRMINYNPEGRFLPGIELRTIAGGAAGIKRPFDGVSAAPWQKLIPI
jgi:hypothetical protein